jgi:hypothetical protein
MKFFKTLKIRRKGLSEVVFIAFAAMIILMTIIIAFQ